MDGIGIREATLEDTEVLATLMTDLGYPTSTGEMARRFERVSADPSYDTLVAEIQGTVVGMTGVHLERAYEADRDCVRIMAFVVASEHRGHGVGRALIEAAEYWASERGADVVMLTTHKCRTGSHRFYRRMGYENIGYRFHKILEDADG